jgi:hypothetical protein
MSFKLLIHDSSAKGKDPGDASQQLCSSSARTQAHGDTQVRDEDPAVPASRAVDVVEDLDEMPPKVLNRVEI